MSDVTLLITDVNPTPWMAPDLAIGRGNGGKTYPMAYSPAAMRAYQDAIKESFDQAYPDHEAFPKGTPLIVAFYFWRKLDTYKTKTGRNQTAKRADATNMTKSTEDALQGRLYVNDVDNVATVGFVVEQSTDTEPAVMVHVGRFGATRWTQFLDDRIVHNVRDRMLEIESPNPPGNVYLKDYR